MTVGSGSMSAGEMSERSGAAGGEEAEVEMTPGEIVEELRSAWESERLSPGLGVGREELVEALLDQVGAMERNLASSKAGASLRNQIHRLELERLRFVMTSYLRTRVGKLESSVGWYLAEANRRRASGLADRLSAAEEAYAVSYAKARQGHLSRVLSAAGVEEGGSELEGAKEAPGEGDWVFGRAETELGSVWVSEEESARLEQGSQYLLPYSQHLQDLIDARQVTLI